MTGFFPLLRLQLLSRYADLKPRNLMTQFREKKGRTIGMIIGLINHGKLIAQGTLEELRSAEAGASLEELFLELTDDGGETA